MKKHKYIITSHNMYKLINGDYHAMFYKVDNDKVIYINTSGMDNLIPKFGSDNITDIYDYFHKTPWCSDLLIKYDQVLNFEMNKYKIDIINKVLQEACQNDE